MSVQPQNKLILPYDSFSIETKLAKFPPAVMQKTLAVIIYDFRL